MSVPETPDRPALPAPDPWPAATVGALGAALVAAIVYRDVLRGYFWNDDFAWLFVLHDRGLGEFLLTPMGGHTLVARNAVFAVLDRLAGLDPRPWFASVLATHALNVALLCRIIWLASGRAGLAAVAAVAWGIGPLVSESLAWYSVYGQVAATTCLLVVLGRVMARARDRRTLSGGDLVFIATVLGVSSLFFGTALAFACVWPIVAALLVPASVASRAGALRVLAVSGLVLLLYGGLQLLARGVYATPVYAPGALGWVLRRPWPTAVAVVQLVRVGVASLLLGSWWLPGPRADLPSWMALAATAVVTGVALVRAPADRRAAIAACGLAGLASYALIAIARAPLAGALLGQSPAQVGATARYHYVPLAFLAVALAVAFDVLAPRRMVVPVAWAVVLLAGQLRNGVAVDLHEASRAEVTRALASVHAGVDAAPPGTVAYVANTPLAAFGWLPNTTERPPGLAALFVIAFPRDTVDGREVRFVEPNPQVRERAWRRGGRAAALLVATPPQGAGAVSSAWTRSRSVGVKRSASSAARARSRSSAVRAASASIAARAAR
jgi:hypothetical protein